MSTVSADAVAELLDDLATTLAGELVRPGDPSYDEARSVWNGMIDLRPAAIVRCASAADVRDTLRVARESGLPLAVRGGGHNVAGFGTVDGGLVVDLSPLNVVTVDPVARRVRAGGGALLRDLDAATQAHGLAVPAGVVSETGIAGLTLSGGLGWLRRTWGLSSDNLVGAELVTAAGEIIGVDETTDPDLLWGLRGGGGNFGVVTSFEYRLHPVTQVLGGLVIYPLDQARDMLRFYRDFCPGLPDEAEAYTGLLTSPEGIPVAALILGYNGPLEEGEKVLAPARKFGRPVADLVGPMPYRARQTLLDEPNATHGLHRYWRSAFTERISDGLIDVLVENAASFTSPLSALIFFYMHGAGTRVPPTETAFAARRPQWDFDAIGQWADGAQSAGHIAWVRALWSRLEPHLEGSAYINHLAEDDRPEKVRASFGENYGRLRQLKAVYDPTNLFRINANIAPA
jgi:FAD/FMN-containing dehydrogenase